MSDLDLGAILGRYSSWHGCADNDEPGGAADMRWPHADNDETMSHYIVREDVPALVAEVRSLRARFRLCNGCDATIARCNEYIEAGAIKCCPDCHHDGP